MITKKVIDTIYSRYKKRPKSTDDLNIALLFEGVSPLHGIEIDGNLLRVNSVSPQSPFHEIPLSAVHAIVEFEEHVAIVLHSSILFLNKENEGVSVHIKPYTPTLKDRLSGIFSRQ